MKKLSLHYVLYGRKQRVPYNTSQSLCIGSVISKLGRVVGHGWEGDKFVVHVR